MAFSGGTFTIDTAGNPVVTGTTISSTVNNNTMTEIATGLTLCILKDGTQTTTASIPFAQDIDVAGTVNVTGDTAAGDDASIGHTAAEGIIITGQGSSNDVTIKNDADADVITIATGTTNVDVVGDLTAATVNADGDTSAGDKSTLGYTGVEGAILTGQGSTSDVTIKNDADATVASVPTGTTEFLLAGGLSGDFIQGVNQFRLTLTSGLAVTTADVSAAGTVYMALYDGNQIALYTGARWTVVTSAQLSIAVSSTAGRPFDIFCDYNGGTPALRITDWTTAPARATALTTQDGVLVQTGNLDWRYLGTARTISANQVSDSAAFRHLWNYYHRKERSMLVVDTTNTWTYTTATIRQANGSTANQLDYVIGVAEDMIIARVASAAQNTGQVTVAVGVGLDTTSGNSVGFIASRTTNPASNVNVTVSTDYQAMASIGRHYLVWTEYSVASGTTTWYGDNGSGGIQQSGIQGSVWA